METLDELKKQVQKKREALPPVVVEKYLRDFAVTYTHESTAMEGNTLSLRETALLLVDGVTVGGKNLREIYEVTNHDKAFSCVLSLIHDGRSLDESIVKDLHEILMQNIFQGGAYRVHNVRITGATHRPPEPYKMREEIKFFFADLPGKRKLHPVDCAAWVHAEFVRIHPFADGNGRTARLIMNYELMAGGFLPISISTEEREAYYTALDQYATSGDIKSFTDMVACLERERLLDFLTI